MTEASTTDAAKSATTSRRRRPARLAWYLLTLLVLVTLNFVLPRAMPGDPISAMTAQAATSLDRSERAALNRYYGLDRSLPEQYLRYLGALARGDLGVSIVHNRPVSGLLVERLPWTLLLALTSVGLATAVGTLAGVRSGWRRRQGVDRALLTLVVASWSIPPFFLGSVALFVFAGRLRWFPLFGATTAFSTAGGLARVADVAHHLALPALTMALLVVAPPYLLMRAGMARELGADHLQLGRAKGLRERRLKYSYAARNALLPVLTTTSLTLGVTVAGGLVFIERVFAYPGIGQLLVDAAGARDYPTLQGCFLVASVLVMGLNFLTDALYGRLDPRAAG